MSGGRLVVLDRLGRAGKTFPLSSGTVALGRAPACDIRILLPSVDPHHATIAVHQNQTVVSNMSDGDTLVNGRAVSVAALRHNDVITIGDRQLRWEYDNPHLKRPLWPEPAIYSKPRASRVARRVTAAGATDPSLHRTLQMHRASMPGNAGGKQVAIVQPQRRDTSEHTESSGRAGGSPRGRDGHAASQRRAARPSPNNLSLQNTTKATLWIESRKVSPRKSGAGSPAGRPRRAAVAASKATPLRMTVLRKAQSARKINVTKIEAPLKIDHMKQAALMLITGHTPKSRVSGSPAAKRPSLVVKRTAKPSPRRSNARKSGRRSAGKSVSILEVTDSEAQDSITSQSNSSVRSRVSTLGSPLLPSPKKSALKDPTAKRSVRKTESIKFDLSNLENYHDDDDDILMVTDTSKAASRRDTSSHYDSVSQEDLTLHYSDTSSVQSPSPRRSIHSRTSRMLEQVGSPLKDQIEHRTLTPESPRARKSLRGSIILQKALDTSDNSRYSRRTTKTLTDQSWDTTTESAFKTRTLSPRSAPNLESYSIVDLVSMDSNETGQSASVYNSVGSTRSSSIMFGTPQTSSRKTRSTIGSNFLTSSTPYAGKTRVSNRSNSSPNVSSRKASPNKSDRKSVSRRSQSLTTPENSEETQKHISINSTRISRASRSRTRINDSDLQFIATELEVGDVDHSPKTSRRGSKVNKSQIQTSPSPQGRKSQIQTSPSPRGRKSQTQASPSPRGRKSQEQSSPSPRGRKSQIQTSPSPRGRKSQIQTSPSQSPRGRRSQIQTSLSPRGRNSQIQTSPSPSPRGRNSQIQTSPSPRGRNSQIQTSPSPRGRKSQIQTSPSPRGRNSQIQTSPISQGRKSQIETSLSRGRKSQIQANPSPRGRKSEILNNTGPRARRSQKQATPSPKSSPTKSLNPKTSPRKSSSPKSPRKSSNQKASPRNRSSRTNLTLDVTHETQDEGIVTPENRLSPQEIGTPVLSIQTLLDSSQSSFSSQRSNKKTRGSTNLKRKTIGVLRSQRKGRNSLKSKSFTVAARKSLRSLRTSKESDKFNRNAQEDNVTPKSAVKLVQEAVKNKHSTAKKPQSKRSIIDNLNESDIVKQLFNSPVKRKLSQSMTEFSRKKLFDDDELVRRPTRNTIALGRSPDTSLSGRSQTFTPEDFVSPLSTPSHSPNLTGIKRLYARNTPQNDLRNVKGVKTLLRSRKSVKNDLTNVSGVKEVFAKSPRNDLRRVSGVKSLFQAQQKGKTPDLRDVRGLKKLYTRKSAANDLRNVSGVKKILQTRSPKNDLTDVRGVKRMFRKDHQDDYFNVSGVEELFNESNPRNSDTLFDQLIGKPTIKSVYSKSMVTKRTQQEMKRSARSLNSSIGQITSNVEEWLEQELNKHLHKTNKSTANVSRELSKLATDTVEGSVPVKTSRNRSSTLVQTLETSGKRSASQVYSVHMLPIKKRSFVEASLQKSNDTNVSKTNVSKSNVSKSNVSKTNVSKTNVSKTNVSKTNVSKTNVSKTNVSKTNVSKSNVSTQNVSKANKSNNLPIKKRAVVHSTPVKGRYNVTMNASELGRVSPIVFDRTQNIDTIAAGRSTQHPKLSPRSNKRTTTNIIEESLQETKTKTLPSPKPVGKRGKGKIEEVPTPRTPKPSPKAKRTTRAKNVETETTTTRGSRTRNKENQEPKSPERKGRNTKVAGRKAISPKSIATDAPQKTRRTRNNTDKQESLASPKPKRGARANVSKAKAPQSKKSPVKASPKKTRGARAKPQTPLKPTRSQKDATEVTNTKKHRKSLVITKKAPIMSPKPRKGKEVKIEAPKPTRKRKAEVSIEVKSPKRTRAKLVVSKPSPKLNPRGKSATRGTDSDGSKKESPKKSQTGRGRRNVTVTATKAETSKSKAKPPPKRGRKPVETQEPPTKKGRNAPTPSPKTSRTRRNVSQETTKATKTTAKSEATKPRGRKRKSADDLPTVPAKVSKLEGTKTVAKGAKEKAPAKATKSKKEKEVVNKMEQTIVSTRSKRQANVSEQKKAQKPSKVVKTPAKKTPVKASPVKKSTRGKKEAAASPAAGGRSRKNAKVVSSPVKVTKNTRSRRR